jgi:membrane protease YdiL (CAAX protease family)
LVHLLAVGLVVWLLRSRRESLGHLGLDWREGSARLLSQGFLAGTLLVAVLSLIQWALGARVWQLHGADLWHWMGFFFKGFGAGVLIGAIEEFFFRGFLFVTFKDLWNTKVSLIMTNLIYAVVHFFPKNKPLTGPEPTAWDSFRLIGFLVPSLFEKLETLLALLGLFLFGLILSFSFLRTGSLFGPMGIHAGCVFGLKMNRRFVPDLAEKMGVLSGSKNLYDGMMGLTVLAALALFLGMGVKKMKRTTRGGRGFSIALILCLVFLGPPAYSRETAAPAKNIIYSFLESFPRAQVVREREGLVYRGKWMARRFQFEGLPITSDIFVSETVMVGGKTRPVIQFPALPGFKSTVLFPKVPPARKLRVFFALSDEAFPKEGIAEPVQFEVWIGRKKLHESRLNSRGWQEKTLDLTILFLLQRTYTVTFKLSTSGADSKSFAFYGYLK